MPTFEIQGAKGEIFEVEAPDEQSAVTAFRKFQPEPIGAIEDVATQLPVGVTRGVTNLGGAGGDVREALVGGIRSLAQRFGLDDDAAESVLGLTRGALRAIPILGGPTSEQALSAVEGITGELPKAQTTAGEFARTVGEFAPGAALPGSLATRAAQVLAPALASETAGQLTEGTNIEPFARLAGAILGGGAIPAARRAITPTGRVDSEIAASVARLEERGVTSITAGQRTGNPVLTKREALTPESFAGATLDRGQEQFTQAALRLSGIEARRATPDVIDDAFRSIGKEFDIVQARNRIILPAETKTAIQRQITQASESLAEGRLPKFIKKLPKRLSDRQVVTGTEYKELRSRLTEIARGKKSDITRPVNRIVSLLDQAAEASIKVTNPQDLGRFRELRGFYQNLLILEKAASGAGKEAAIGIITPARLQSATKLVQGSRAITRGGTEAGQLSRAGVGVLQRPPSSGTPEGLLARGLGRSLASIPGDLARSATLTRIGQSALGNQRFPGAIPGGISGPSRAILAGTLARGNQ